MMLLVKRVLFLPPGFNFTSVVTNEIGSVERFFTKYREEAPVPGGSLYGLGLRELTLGLVGKSPFHLYGAWARFAGSLRTAQDDRERELARLALRYTEALLSGTFPKAADNGRPEPLRIEKVAGTGGSCRKIVVGRSAIRVDGETKIAAQVDRVTRDWLLGENTAAAPWDFAAERAVPWHEGEKVREIVALSGARVMPVTGTRVKRFGDSWYAPDGEGVYRFELSVDKVVSYPTTLLVDDRTAVINDTHGISAIAWGATGADLAIGCGDYPGKVEAAYYLAQRGVNVYMPTDRFLGLLIGAQTKGMVIGSAPVKKSGSGAVIGDQPVTIDLDEPIVVSTASGGYPMQYYDTPSRYFGELEKFLGRRLTLIPVPVPEYGMGGVVIEKARAVGAKVVALRVWGREEHNAVAAWLQEDPARRALLFHSAVYPECYRPFSESPRQTSFGDINVACEP